MADYIAQAADNGETLKDYNHNVAGEVNLMDGDRIISTVNKVTSEEVTSADTVAAGVAASPPVAADRPERPVATFSSLTVEKEIVEGEDALDMAEFESWRAVKRAERGSRPTAVVDTAAVPLEVLAAQLVREMSEARQAISSPPVAAVSVAEPARVGTTPAIAQTGSATLAHLSLDFLGMTEPQRARVPVVFRGSMGIMTVPYHAVVVTPKIVALIYDTRYDQGVQFLPAATAEKLEVDVPSQSTGLMTCASLDISWSLGCMDIAVLLRE